jgi:hypothetical protein
LFEEEVMTCSDWQLKIAAETEDSALAEHLGGCEACREFAQDLTENAAALRAIEVDPVAYTAVRARVLAAVRPRRRFAWLWAAAAGAVAACAALVWFAADFRAPVLLPEVAHKVVSPPPTAPSRLRLGTEPRALASGFRDGASAHRRARDRRLVARTEPLTAIKLLTDDPNVVIIWLVDKKGD